MGQVLGSSFGGSKERGVSILCMVYIVNERKWHSIEMCSTVSVEAVIVQSDEFVGGGAQGEGQTVIFWFYSARWSCHGDCFQFSQDGCCSLVSAANRAHIHNVGLTDRACIALIHLNVVYNIPINNVLKYVIT